MSGAADGKPTMIDDVDREGADGALDAAAFLLYRKAVRQGTWQPSAIDLSKDRADLDRLDEQRRAYLERFAAAFFNAEENVAKLFGPWVIAAPSRWIHTFFSTQLLEEFKQTEFFFPCFGEVLAFGTSGPSWRIRYRIRWRHAPGGFWKPSMPTRSRGPSRSIFL